MNRNILTTFVLSLATLVLFQNCDGYKTSKVSNDLEILRHGAICPMYTAPQCEDNEELNIQLNSDGCEQPVCVPRQSPVTTVDIEDLIGDEVPNEEPVEEVTEDEVTPKECPIYNEPQCKKNEVIVITSDANQCPMPVCERKSNPKIQCPIYNRPLCADNEVLSVVTDDFGCEKPVCVAK